MRPSACGFCLRPFDESARALPGRICCRRCGAQTTDPWPTEAELDVAYGGWYRPATGRFGKTGDRLLRLARQSLARRLDAIAPPGPVLDVGAGDGSLLDALSHRGRAALGLERDSGRPDVVNGDLASHRGPWAAIVLWHSLEHLRDPGTTLELAARSLLPGGMLVIAMPNATSWQARTFGSRWFALDAPRHLVHLPAQTLLGRLRALGLEIRRVSYLRGGQVVFGWIHGLVGLFPGHPDLYIAIRQPSARVSGISSGSRWRTLVQGMAVAPLAALLSVLEIGARHGGTIYVEAQLPSDG